MIDYIFDSVQMTDYEVIEVSDSDYDLITPGSFTTKERRKKKKEKERFRLMMTSLNLMLICAQLVRDQFPCW